MMIRQLGLVFAASVIGLPASSVLAQVTFVPSDLSPGDEYRVAFVTFTGLSSSASGHAHRGVTRTPPRASVHASSVPLRESLGLDCAVITIVSLLANRFARLVDAPSPTEGTAAGVKLPHLRASSRACA